MNPSLFGRQNECDIVQHPECECVSSNETMSNHTKKRSKFNYTHKYACTPLREQEQ